MEGEKMPEYSRVPFYDVDITGGFWAQRQKLNTEVTMQAVLDRFTETGRFAAFRCDWREGDENRPHIFYDSDCAKWMEAVAYIREKQEVPAYEEVMERTIDYIERQQTREGYVNSYFNSVEPTKRWYDRSWHELYCAGHLIEAAVAWKHATGRDRFEKIMCRYADYIDRVFRVEHSAHFLTPGHEEIELALVKLYKSTGNEKYLNLSRFFVDMRGNNDIDPKVNTADLYSSQSHLPVREMTTAEGHSVRAGYLFSAMADLALECGDKALLAACEKLFDNIYYHRMYITGGVGSTCHNEAYTADYDLPNVTAYTETCAAIALAYFAGRMLLLKPEAKYADCVEKIMYNCFLSGTSLDGRCFFYSNPMEINLKHRYGHPSTEQFDWLPATQRVEVFGCSCCPPNVNRFVASIGDFAMSESKERVYLHQFFDMTAKAGSALVTVETDYPVSGKLHIKATGMNGRALCVRIPGWCGKYSFSAPCTVENGYAVFAAGDVELTAEFDMTPCLVEANPGVADNAGKVAVMRGPIVYCIEAVDNGELMNDMLIKADTAFTESALDFSPLPMLMVDGMCRAQDGSWLYRALKPEYKKTAVKLIPYYCFANRGESDLKVWIPLAR